MYDLCAVSTSVSCGNQGWKNCVKTIARPPAAFYLITQLFCPTQRSYQYNNLCKHVLHLLPPNMTIHHWLKAGVKYL